LKVSWALAHCGRQGQADGTTGELIVRIDPKRSSGWQDCSTDEIEYWLGTHALFDYDKFALVVKYI
jgi:hypothetical protein